MQYSQMIAAQKSIVVSDETPIPARGEVLMHIRACGVCASELHPWLGEGSDVRYPRRLGHEPAGDVVAVGADVTRFKVGDRVTGLSDCAYTDYRAIDEKALLPLPDNVPYEQGLGEPLACLVNAQRRTAVPLASRVAIVGLGFMGLGMLQLVRLRNPGTLVAIDPRWEARKKALEMGATEAYAPDEVPDQYYVTEWQHWPTTRGLDVVIEGSGTQAGLTLASKLVRAHGLLSILGYHQGGMRSVDMEMWNWKAIDVVNAHVRRFNDLMESMRVGLELLASKKLDLASLVTHRYPLSDVDQAYIDMRSKPAGFIKGVVLP